MDVGMETETWWMELQLWPVVLRIEMEIYIEQRGLPGMCSYQCLWNDFVALFWQLCGYFGYSPCDDN